MHRLIPKQQSRSDIFAVRRVSMPLPPMRVTTGSLLGSGMSGVMDVAPELRNPLLNIENFFFPFSRQELYRWVKYYVKVHPIVSNAIDLHRTLPWARFEFTGIADLDILSFYSDLSSALDLLSMYTKITDDYFTFGEAFPFLNWNSNLDSWDWGVVLDPELINVKINPFNPSQKFFTRKVDNTLRDLFSSLEKDDIEIKETISKDIAKYIQDRKDIPIDDFYISHICRGQQEDGRGTSLILACLKDLLYEDKLRQAQYVTAIRRISPMEHWEIGDTNAGDMSWLPTEDYLKQFQMMLARLGNEVSPLLLTTSGHKWNAYGMADRFLNLQSEFEFIARRLLIALFTNETATTGTGPSFATASVAMRYIQSRYDHVTSLVLNWAENKVFLPVAIANSFFKPMEKVAGSRILVDSLLKKKYHRYYIQPLLEERKEVKASLEDKIQKYEGDVIAERKDTEISAIYEHLGKLNSKLASAYIKYKADLWIPDHQFKGKVNLLTDEGKREFLSQLMSRGLAPVKMLADIFDVNYDELRNLLGKQMGMSEKEIEEAGDEIFDSTWQDIFKRKKSAEAEKSIRPQEVFPIPPDRGVDREFSLPEEQIRLPEEPFSPEGMPGESREELMTEL